MKCLKFGQLLTLLALCSQVYASELRNNLRLSVDGIDHENCGDVSESLIYQLDNLNADDINKELKQDGHAVILNDLWSIKTNLHERLRAFYRMDELTPECAAGVRGVLRGIRTFEDNIEVNYLKTERGQIIFPSSAFEPGNLHVKRAPEFAGFDLNKDLKSGDIILSRGNAYTSAAISMLGEYDTQFSHLSVVYKDEDGKFWTVEAHIEVGSFVRPLEDHIEDSNFRTMIYRFDDEAVAARAAKFIFEKVKKASDTKGNILYDFGFDLDENTNLFCSEVASLAYSEATQNEVKIPMFRSKIQSRKPLILKQLGISVKDSFIPADLEVDPRFKIVAEWKDANRTLGILQKDALIQAMFKWSDEENYVLQQGSTKDSFIYRNIAWPLRRVPILKKYFVDKMPINMSRKLIGYFGVIETLGKFFQEKIDAKDKVVLEERGLPLSKKEKADLLEQIRQEDLASQKKKLHKMFRPNKKD